MYLIFKYVLYMYVYMRNNKQKTSLFLLKIHVVNLTLKVLYIKRLPKSICMKH